MLCMPCLQKEREEEQQREVERAAKEKRAEGERNFQAWLEDKARAAAKEKERIRAYWVRAC